MIVNKIGFQKTKKPIERFTRPAYIYRPEILEEWKLNVIYRVKQMIAYQEADYYPRNFTSCEKFNGCYLQRFCTTSPGGREFLIGTEYKIADESWDASRKLEREEIK